MNSMLLMACLAVFDVQITSGSVDEMVDVIELHHGHDFRGRLAFRQLIFYRWSSYHRRFQVVDTVVVTSDKMLPKKSSSGVYRCRWREEGQTREVTSLTYRESHSAIDPEVKERDFLPTHLRAGLKRIHGPSANAARPLARTSLLPPPPEKLFKF